MRNKFDEQLEKLNNELIAMGMLCESAIANAAKSISTGNPEYFKAIKLMETDIDQKEHDIESLCMKLLMQQQPVAKDLRFISAAMKMITDMERIGDQAVDIAEIIAMGYVNVHDDTVHIEDMARATIKMVTESIDAFVKRDLLIAQAVIEYDDIVDGLFNKVKGELVQYIKSEHNHGEFAIDLLMIAKYFERIGDHAVNIAEWVQFAITGKHKGEDVL
ncbi:MAG: phosphate transport system regulatory protein PhoU [Clostridiales bacterium GWF2_38_85]|nr:MAG: phosphate transport system regulatory protein PhoU [Clostridiales bacterium GWF2_38_85]HBL83925.1 phosphate transport system regulatory protein PhoU [Clostridiales bacterium]